MGSLRAEPTGAAEEFAPASGHAAPIARAGWPVGPTLLGLLGTAGLLGLYLGIITLAQGWEHAIQQLGEDRWFIGALTIGFGIQIGLFAYLRGGHVRAAAGGVAASTGTSTAAMLACCAHHLSDLLPILGVSGATIFLEVYKTPLLWLGIAMNLFGIIYLLRRLRQQHSMVSHHDWRHRPTTEGPGGKEPPPSPRGE